MNYIFPETKFAKENTDIEQINHVFSEVKEILQECKKEVIPAGLIIKSYNDSFIEEAVDLYHSLETLFRILELHGVDMDAVQRKVFEKNRRRGYYDD
jgi:hypothetical protein